MVTFHFKKSPEVAFDPPPPQGHSSKVPVKVPISALWIPNIIFKNFYFLFSIFWNTSGPADSCRSPDRKYTCTFFLMGRGQVGYQKIQHFNSVREKIFLATSGGALGLWWPKTRKKLKSWTVMGGKPEVGSGQNFVKNFNLF
jgi:hypothetical protein